VKGGRNRALIRGNNPKSAWKNSG